MSPRPSPEAAPCPHCGVIDRPTLSPGKGPHAVKASCGHCGRFLRWVSLLAPAERVARKLKALQHYPPSVAQLAYLKALGDRQATPQNMAGSIAEN
jgi:hypothetical protein